MKIAFINFDDTLGGASIAALRLAKSIKQMNHKVIVFTQSKKTKNPIVKAIGQGFFFRLKIIINFIKERLYFLPFEKNKTVRFAFSPAFSGLDITEYVDLNEYDIVHLHWTNFGFLSLKSLEKIFASQKAIVWTMHDMWAFTGGCHYSNDCINYINKCENCKEFLKNPSNNDLSSKVYTSKQSFLINASNATFVGCSQWLANLAKLSSLLSQNQVISIPNPIDTSLFKPLKKEESLRDLNLNSSVKYVLFVAMKISNPRKGLNQLLKAFEQLSIAKPDEFSSAIELLIVGENPGGIFNDLPFKTHFLGQISNKKELNIIYNAADVFVIPSLQDNLPNTIMEALATGTPCVGFDVGGIPEMIEHKKNGYVAEYLNPEDLANGMKWVLENENYAELSNNALEKVKREYTTEVVAQQYIELYERMLTKSA